MTQDFEQSIVQGKACWISSFAYELSSSRLVIGVIEDVDSPEPARVIEFTEVEKLESDWTNREDGTLEGLLGAHEMEADGLLRYLLVTDQREIEIVSRKRVSILLAQSPVKV